MSPLLLTASVLDAARRGLRGDFAGRHGKFALALTAAAWALLGLIHRRNVASAPPFEAGLREALGDDYASLAATSQPALRHPGVFGTGLSRRRYVEKTSTVRYGPHGGANLADIWRRSDLPRDGRAPVLLQVPGGAWAIGMRRPQGYPLMSDLAERGWVCVSIAYRVSPAQHLARPHRRRQAGAGLGQGEHRRLRRRSGLRRDQRRFGRRAPHRVGRADRQRPPVPARIRRCRHLGGGRGSGVRPL